MSIWDTVVDKRHKKHMELLSARERNKVEDGKGGGAYILNYG